MNFVEWGNKQLEEAEEQKKQKRNVIQMEYRKAHPEIFKAIRTRYNEAHPGREKASEKKYRETHREEINERSRIRCKNKPEQIKSWRKAHPIQVKAAKKRAKNKRKRNLGYIPLNTPFAGSDGHHIDKDYIVYIPSELHRSIYHSIITGKNMKEINLLALDYLKRVDIKEVNKMGKSPETKKVLDNFAKDLFGKSLTKANEEKVCVFCHKPVKTENFRNEISRREYRISGICQRCQDDVFRKD